MDRNDVGMMRTGFITRVLFGSTRFGKHGGRHFGDHSFAAADGISPATFARETPPLAAALCGVLRIHWMKLGSCRSVQSALCVTFEEMIHCGLSPNIRYEQRPRLSEGFLCITHRLGNIRWLLEQRQRKGLAGRLMSFRLHKQT